MIRAFTTCAILRLGVVIGIAALIAPEGVSQSLVYGGLTGVVRDESGRAVMDAEVLVLDRLSGARRELSTGREGELRVAFLTPSTYDIRIEALGYVPALHRSVVVRAGVGSQLVVTLRRAVPPVSSIDTVRSGPGRPVAMDWLRERGYAALLGGQRTAHDASSISVVSDDGSVEGLPWRLTDGVVDGAMVDGSGLGGFGSRFTLILPLPIEALSGAVAGGLDFDTEIGGSGVGLMTRSRRGGDASRMIGSIYGGTFDRGGVFRLDGPVQRDTAHALIGIDYQYAELPREAAISAGDSEGQALLTTARDDFGLDLRPHALATPQVTERGGAYVRLDWDLADRFAISMRASGTRVLSADPAFPESRSSGIGSRLEATTMHASVNIRTRLTRRLTSEFRVAGGFFSAESRNPGVPTTTFAGRGLTLGAAGEEPLADSRSSPRLNALLHWDVGRHRLKLGAILGAEQVETEGVVGSGASFRFGDAADFAALLGSYRSVTGPSRSGTFRMSERALIAQDAWRLTDGFDLTFGVRIDKNRTPTGELAQNAAWIAATGVPSVDVRASSTALAPRVGLRWDLGDSREWTIAGGAGVFHDLPDHLMVGEALARDAGQLVRAGAGTLSSWPSTPDASSAPTVGTTLALLGPELQGARTRRAELAISRSSGGWNAYVKGIYRFTDFLGRRRDLNLQSAPGGRDQYGRVLYGGLQQLGTLIIAAPGTNRRFAGFERVDALEATGFSEYRTAVFGLERVNDVGLSFGFEYAYSQTIDNLVSGGGAGLAPVPSGSASEWSEGIADTDAPHRLLAGAEWSLAPRGAFRIGVVYRMRSGVPFTATFRDGVDASADGAPGGDPAFVDPALPGMDALIADWDCLERDSGAFARRNGCRGAFSHRVDLRAVVRLRSLSSGAVDLVMDVLDATSQSRPLVDRALLLVDRTGAITTNPLTGAFTVPLMVNPDFGGALAERSTGLLVRLALRVTR